MPNGEEQLNDTRNGDEPESVARRNLLRMGGIAAAGAAAAAVATAVNASPAGADPVYMELGVDNNTGTEFTVLQGTPQHLPTFLVGNDNGIGMYGYGVDAGVFASTRGYGPALDATDEDSFNSGSGLGSAIKAHLDNINNSSSAVDASTKGFGHAINAHIDNTFSDVAAVVATTDGSGPVLTATITDPENESGCVIAHTHGPGPAIQAVGRTVDPKAGVGAGNGVALDVVGRSNFSRSGVVTIAAGASSALTELVPGGLFGASHVLATPQTNVALAVRAAVPLLSGVDKGKVHIHLTTKAPAGGVRVAWLVIG